MAIEETLASLANSKLNQYAPSLVPHLIGFELIDSNDKGDYALGTSICQIGETYIYIPVVLRRGKIYDIDIMYIPSLDQFIPTDDEWISYLKSKKTDLEVILKDKNKGKRTLSSGAGDVDLSMPFNNITKTASNRVKIKLRKVAACMVEVLDSADVNYTLPSAIELLDVLPLKGVRKLADYIQSEDGAESFSKFYTNEDLEKVVKAFDKAVDAYKPLDIPDSEPSIKVLTSASRESKDLTNEDKVTILRDGAIIKDNRGLTPSVVYKEKHNKEWQTPTDNGLYELLRSDGKTLTAYVLNDARGLNDDKVIANPLRHSPSFLVIPMDDMMARKAYRVEKSLLGQSLTDDLKELDISSLRSAGTDLDAVEFPEHTFNKGIIMLSPKGEFVEVCMTKKGQKVTGGQEDMQVNCQLILKGSNSKAYDTDKSNHMAGLVGRKDTIDKVVYGKASSTIRRVGNTLRVPEGTKCIQVIELGNYSDDAIPKEIGALADFAESLDAMKNREDILNLSITMSNGLYYVYENGKLTKSASDFVNPLNVQKHLVKKFAVLPEDASMIVKEANSSKVDSYLVKIAYDTQASLYTSEEPSEQSTVEGISLEPIQMSDEDKAILQNAQESGVKEIFDISLLRMMAEEDNPSKLISEWVPGLFIALDKLARVLLLCRVGDAMGETYGEDRANMLEQKLQKQVSALGGIILSLQQGQVQTTQEMMALSI